MVQTRKREKYSTYHNSASTVVILFKGNISYIQNIRISNTILFTSISNISRTCAISCGIKFHTVQSYACVKEGSFLRWTNKILSHHQLSSIEFKKGDGKQNCCIFHSFSDQPKNNGPVKNWANVHLPWTLAWTKFTVLLPVPSILPPTPYN